MSKARIAILLGNLGTPVAPTSSAVRAFLKPFLSDRRVVEVPRPIWLMILHGFILPFRPKPVAEKYHALWEEFGDSPLRLITQGQVEKLRHLVEAQYGKGQVLVDYVFAYGEPSLVNQIEKYRKLADKIVILPLYPQYSCSTTAAFSDQLAKYQMSQRYIADVELIREYYAEPLFISALAQSVEAFWQEHGRGDYLLMSYHGVPQAYADKGDPYQMQCLATSEALAKALGLDATHTGSSFQSRLGKAQWLQPYTDVTVKALAQKGIKTLDVICPSFSVDCLETLEEISVENAQYFTEAGGVRLRLVPCLNDSDSHIAMMAKLITPAVSGAL